MRHPAVERQAGFTLIELLVAVMIEALIVGALGVAFVGILHGTTQVNQSLSQSVDARDVAAYLVSDAGNSSGPETVLGQLTMCPSVALTTGSKIPFRFTWSSTSSTGTPPTTVANVVDYVEVPTVPATVPVSYTLVRRQCQNGVLLSTQTLAQNVLAVGAACSPTVDCSGDPTSITVTITETAASSGAGYTYSLTGAYQKLIGDGDPGPAASVILLGGGTCGANAGVNLSGSGSMRVYGDAYLNTKDNGSNCGAITLSGGASYQGGTTSILTGGTCQAPAYITCPTVSNYPTQKPDPYQTLTAPSTAGRPAQTASTQCASPNSTAQPGVYAAKLVVTSSNSCQLASGVYILQAGIEISGNVTLSSAPGGVLLYITGGTFLATASGAVNISAQTTGQWAGLLIWEAKSDPGTITYSGNAPLTLNGVVYAPTSQVNISGSAANPTVTGVVAQSVFISGTGKLFVGPTPTITTESLPDGEQTVAYSTQLAGTGGNTPYSWSATGLPTGLTMTSAGLISGTPTAAGVSSVVVRMTEATGTQVTSSLSLAIGAGPSITTTTPLPDADKTVAYSATLTATGGTAPYTWALASGTPPAGLTLSAGAITGTPSATGTSSFVVKVTDAAGATTTASLSLTVNAVPTISTGATLTAGEATVSQTWTLAGAGGTSPYSWSLASGSLPGGLLLSSAGSITGAPTGSGTSAFVVKLTDAAGATVTKSLSLTINPQPTITNVRLLNKTGGTAGKIETGDQIVVTFSAQMNANTICSSWADGTANRNLSSSTSVVTLANGSGTTTDTMTVATTACTFHFGTISLGSNLYVASNNLTFGTSAVNTTFAWSSSANTLTIVLGTQAGTGTAGTVSAGSQPSFTASSLITDPATASVSNLTFNFLAVAKQF